MSFPSDHGSKTPTSPSFHPHCRGGVCAPPYFQYYNPCDLVRYLGSQHPHVTAGDFSQCQIRSFPCQGGWEIIWLSKQIWFPAEAMCGWGIEHHSSWALKLGDVRLNHRTCRHFSPLNFLKVYPTNNQPTMLLIGFVKIYYGIPWHTVSICKYCTRHKYEEIHDSYTIR